VEERTKTPLLPSKSRLDLQKIFGIIETNAIYLTANNEVAGNYTFHNS
jgi:hypothetical protein